MPIFQTKTAKGLIQPGRSLSAGAVMAVRGVFIASTAFVAAADKVELVILPPFCRIVDMTVIGELADVVTANIGFMSGEAGNPDNARTVGSEFFAAIAVQNTVSRMSLMSGFKQVMSESPRGIGATISANVGALASKTLELIVFYSADY